jgi:hypothetical protein
VAGIKGDLGEWPESYASDSTKIDIHIAQVYVMICLSAIPLTFIVKEQAVSGMIGQKGPKQT